jgi:hypothetical protein
MAMVFLHQLTVTPLLDLFNCRTGGFAIAVLIVFLKLNPTKRSTVKEVAQTFDFIGLILFVSGIVLFLTGLASGGNGTFAWTSSVVLGTLIPGVVCFVAAVINELYTKRQPLIPPRLFKTRTTGGVLISVFLHAVVFTPAIYYMPLYFQAVDGASATMSGVQLLPLSLMTAIVATATGFIIAKTGDYRWVLWICWVVLTLGIPLNIQSDGRYGANDKLGLSFQHCQISHLSIDYRCRHWGTFPNSSHCPTSSYAIQRYGYCNRLLDPLSGPGQRNRRRHWRNYPEQSIGHPFG